MSKTVLIWVRDIAIALAIAIIIMQFIKPTIVREHSMENTLHPDDYIFLSKQAYYFGEVHRGDIVVFKSHILSADGLPKNLIKRVIALPGDTVAIHDGNVYVNDVAQDQSFTKEGYTSGDLDDITVPDGTLFLMGDNRQMSRDSRDPDVGFVPEDRLIGKAVFRLYPFSGFGLIH